MAHPNQHRGICIQNLIWLHYRAKTDEQSVQKTSIPNNFRDRDHADQKVPPKRDRNQEKPRNRENIGRVEMNRAVGKPSANVVTVVKIDSFASAKRTVPSRISLRNIALNPYITRK